MSFNQGVSSFNSAATPAFLPLFMEAPSVPNLINLLSKFVILSVSREFLIVATIPELKKVFYQFHLVDGVPFKCNNCFIIIIN